MMMWWYISHTIHNRSCPPSNCLSFEFIFLFCLSSILFIIEMSNCLFATNLATKMKLFWSVCVCVCECLYFSFWFVLKMMVVLVSLFCFFCIVVLTFFFSFSFFYFFFVINWLVFHFCFVFFLSIMKPLS